MHINTQDVLEKIESYRGTKTCSQAVLVAFCEVAGLPTENLDKIALGLTGGIGGTFDEGTCGALTGAIISLGFLCNNEEDIMTISEKLFYDFKGKYSTVNCGPLSNHGNDKLVCVDNCLFVAEAMCKYLNQK